MNRYDSLSNGAKQSFLNRICFTMVCLAGLFIFASCHTSSTQVIPPLSEGKSRVILIMHNDPLTWKMTPCYFNINGTPKGIINAKQYASIDLHPGSYTFATHKRKFHGIKRGKTVRLGNNETKYYMLKGNRKANPPYLRLDGYKKLEMSEITRAQALHYIGKLP